MTNPAPDATELAATLKRLIAYVTDCERRVLKGEILSLEGLDRNVTELCTAITALPRSASQPMEPDMAQLIDHLETLAGAMRAQQDKMQAHG